MDNLTFGPLLLDDEANTQLRPLFLRAIRTYNVELWQDGRLVAVHGVNEWFGTADAVTNTVDAFLAEHGVRALTTEERFELYGGLLREKGGLGYDVLIRQVARRS
jgi:hypothetical protein